MYSVGSLVIHCVRNEPDPYIIPYAKIYYKQTVKISYKYDKHILNMLYLKLNIQGNIPGNKIVDYLWGLMKGKDFL